MGNTNLSAAKAAKNDEFYTQWRDIENEMMAYWVYNKDVFKDKTILLPCDDPEWSQFTRFFARNFEQYQIKKLISTSYAPASNPAVDEHDPADAEVSSDKYDAVKSWERGRKFVLERGVDLTGDGQIDLDDLQWDYLEGDGDFRSEEVTALRDEADIVITNGPFSLFRSFVKWLREGEVQFSVLGSMNAITYKEIFPIIKDNEMWLGASGMGARHFIIPADAPEKSSQYVEDGVRYQKFGNITWFTNIEHGRRHEKMQLMTMADNLMYSRRKKIREQGYPEYDNYDAIEVAFTEAIPKDYDGVLGVPISFLDKYNPEQFEIVSLAAGNSYANTPPEVLKFVKFVPHVPGSEGAGQGVPVAQGKKVYARILIRHRHPETQES